MGMRRERFSDSSFLCFFVGLMKDKVDRDVIDHIT